VSRHRQVLEWLVVYSIVLAMLLWIVWQVMGPPL